MHQLSCVYWIHLPEHTDIFTEGYIGVSVNGAACRFAQHKAATLRGGTYLLHNVIRKYQEALVVDTILQGSPEYCLEIEYRLRPTACIGYNLAIGGNSPNLGRKHTEAAITAMRLAAIGRKTSDATKLKLSVSGKGRVHSEASRNKMSVSRTGHTQNSTSVRQKMSASQKLRPSWNNSNANEEVWKLAEEVFNYHKMHPKHGIMRIGNAFSLDRNNLRVLLEKIKAGWNPSLDPDWLIFSSKLSPDASGDKSLETGISPN